MDAFARALDRVMDETMRMPMVAVAVIMPIGRGVTVVGVRVPVVGVPGLAVVVVGMIGSVLVQDPRLAGAGLPLAHRHAFASSA